MGNETMITYVSAFSQLLSSLVENGSIHMQSLQPLFQMHQNQGFDLNTRETIIYSRAKQQLASFPAAVPLWAVIIMWNEHTHLARPLALLLSVLLSRKGKSIFKEVL